jgi:hypothetical protein
MVSGQAPHLLPLTVSTVLGESPNQLVHTSTRTAIGSPSQAGHATEIEEPLHQRTGIAVGGADEGAIEPV